MPSADKCMKCFKLDSLQSFAKRAGKTVCIFLNVLPFLQICYTDATKKGSILSSQIYWLQQHYQHWSELYSFSDGYSLLPQYL